jgi:hypothetical protein
MPMTVKTKFIGLLRDLLRRFDENEARGMELPRPGTTTTTPLATTAPDADEPMPPMSAPPPGRAENQNELELPLKTVLGALPMDLRAKIMEMPPPGSTMVIPIERILSQLANGSVKVNFGELRQAAPNLFVNSGGENDSRPVTLPLNEILARLNLALLTRRPVQKSVEVADDVTGPFDRERMRRFCGLPFHPIQSPHRRRLLHAPSPRRQRPPLPFLPRRATATATILSRSRPFPLRLRRRKWPPRQPLSRRNRHRRLFSRRWPPCPKTGRSRCEGRLPR